MNDVANDPNAELGAAVRALKDNMAAQARLIDELMVSVRSRVAASKAAVARSQAARRGASAEFLAFP